MKTVFLSQINAQNQTSFERELLCEANISGEIILLLYSWNGDVISTGRLQKKLKIDFLKCERDGVKIVERITGGRAVLHSNDICYSISIPPNRIKKTLGNLKGAVASISQPIIKTFADFNILANCKTYENRNLTHSDFCAQTHSFGEIGVNNKKLVASSQIYSAQGILQHGTIPITADYRKICDYFIDVNESARKFLRDNTTCLNEVYGSLKIEDFICAFVRNFREWEMNLRG